MRPVLFDLPYLHAPIYAYGTMLYLSFLVGWWLTLRLAERDGLSRAQMKGCFIVTAVCALVASRVLFVATNPELFSSAADLVRVTKGGLVAYGGFLGGLLGSMAFCRAVGAPLLVWGDCAVPALCTGLALTRMGCLMAGCDFGKPWHGPWSLRFPFGSPAFEEQVAAGLLPAHAGVSLPVHPTQVYESLAGVLLLAVVFLVRRFRRRYGEALAAFAIGYAALRYTIEIFRADAQRGSIGPFSTSQAIGILTGLAGLGLLAWLRRGAAAPAAASR